MDSDDSLAKKHPRAIDEMVQRIVAGEPGVRWRFLPIGWFEVKSFREIHGNTTKRKVFFVASSSVKDAIRTGRSALPTEEDDVSDAQDVQDFPPAAYDFAKKIWAALFTSDKPIGLGALGTIRTEMKATGPDSPRKIVVFREGAGIAALLNKG